MRVAVVAVLSGSMLAVGAPVAWSALHPHARDFGAARVTALAAPPPSAAPAPSAPSGLPAPSAPAARSARLADRAVGQLDPPARVRVDGLDVPVRPVGLAPGGGVEVPTDVRTAGWYQFGPAPGDPTGATVLVGHVDGAGQGLGAFARLRDLTAGAGLEVRTGSGRVLRYSVVAREQWRKAQAPLARLFDDSGPPRLVLISCAGSFDARTRSYSDNVAVTAVPSP